LRRLLLFSLGGVCVGLLIAGLIALLVDNVTATDSASDRRGTDDCMVVYFRLSEEATWPDGSSMTADDVVFSYNAALLNADANQSPVDERALRDDAGFLCERVDDRTVRFTINVSSRAQMIAMGFDILPKNQLAEYIYNLNPEVPVGSFTDTSTPD
jgi:ABC-type transport system substrate-binding protein